MKYQIPQFDVVYISYDEPDAEENWADLLNKAPWAKRVHGVKGFDSAHREVARIAETDRVFTIDGDNIVDANFFNQSLNIETSQKDYVFSWSGRNVINGLCYGNGGVKLWPRKTLANLASHELANNTDDAVDFCWDINYFQMNDSVSVTAPNASPFQAYRAGHREGVKMSLDRGEKVSRMDFHSKIYEGNLKRLKIWCSVGADIENGLWAMYGARRGCIQMTQDDFDFGDIKDFDWFEEEWKHLKDMTDDELWNMIESQGVVLRNDLHLDVTELTPNQSRFFKSVYTNPERKGLMVSEDG